jgi:hypothetical protein
LGTNEEIHCEAKGTIKNPTIIVKFSPTPFVGFAYEGKDIVFRFIIEYSSLRVIVLHDEVFEFSLFFFCLQILLKCKWQGHIVTHPLVSYEIQRDKND